MPREENDHGKIAAAGWSHRKNHHGFVIYLNPQTGWWHTRLEALAILDNKLVSIAGKETPVDQPRSVRRGPDGTILNTSELSAQQVVHQRVLCPGCGAATFPRWPDGWEAHARSECAVVASGSDTERCANFKRLFGHLFV